MTLKDIGKKIATNPFFNPIGAMANQNKTQKELDAIKAANAAQANAPLPNFTSNTAPPAASTTSNEVPTWAIVTISLVGVGAVVGLTYLIVKAIQK